MGDMTLSQLRAELTYNLANRNDAGTTTARLNRWINQAYLHMTRPKVHRHLELRFRYDLALTLNNNEYSLGSATVGRKVLGVTDVLYYEGTVITEGLSRRNLKPRNIQYMNERPKPPGPPSIYCFDSAGGELLILNTLPTAAEVGRQVRVWYWGEPTKLSLDTNTTVLSNYWDDVLLMGAQFFAEWAVVSKVEATATGQLYQQLINETFDAQELGYEDTEHQVEIESEAYQAR